MKTTSNKPDVKIFISCFLTSELRMHLNHSIGWKHASLTPDSLAKDAPYFQEVRFKGKDYFGFYINDNVYKIDDLDKLQSKIQLLLKQYCPDFKTENLEICIFSQVFVA